MFKRICIIGGHGFVGVYLLKEIAIRFPMAQVLVIDPNSFDPSEDKYTRYPIYREVAHLKYLHKSDSIGHEQTQRSLEEFNPDCIFHLGSTSTFQEAKSGFQQSLKRDLNGIICLYDFLIKSPKTRFIFVSSSSLYSSDLKLAEEDSPISKVSSYQKIKFATESLVKSLGKISSNPVAIVRLTAVYGPGDIKKRLFAKVIESIVEGEELKLHSLDQRLHFTNVKDVSNALIGIASHILEGVESYNIAQKDSFSIRELIQLAEEISEKKLNLIEDRGKRATRRPPISSNKLSREIGISTKVGLSYGIQEYIREVYEC
jgi:nucleoside-diphosphate-sugar epimerase